MDNNYVYAEDYGDLISQITNSDLVFFRREGNYSGDYFIVTSIDDIYFFYRGYFGSCSGCDFLESEDVFLSDEEFKEVGKTIRYKIPYKIALEYTNQSKPCYIIPKILLKNKEELNNFIEIFIKTNQYD